MGLREGAVLHRGQERITENLQIAHDEEASDDLSSNYESPEEDSTESEEVTEEESAEDHMKKPGKTNKKIVANRMYRPT